MNTYKKKKKKGKAQGYIYTWLRLEGYINRPNLNLLPTNWRVMSATWGGHLAPLYYIFNYKYPNSSQKMKFLSLRIGITTRKYLQYVWV